MRLQYPTNPTFNQQIKKAQNVPKLPLKIRKKKLNPQIPHRERVPETESKFSTQPTNINSVAVTISPAQKRSKCVRKSNSEKKNTDSRIDSAISHRSPSGCECVRASKSIVPGEGGRGDEGFQWENETAGLRDDWSYYHNQHQCTRPAPYQHFGLAGILTEGWK